MQMTGISQADKKKLKRLFKDFPGPFTVFSTNYLYNVKHAAILVC